MLATVVLGIDPSRILRDPAAHTAYPFYLGFFSNIGVLAWWTAATSCLTAALVLRGWHDPAWRALAMGGGLSVMLGLDDLLLLHEEAFPNTLGVPEELTFLAYGVATLAYLWRFRRFHLAMEAGLLLAALACFAGSAFADLARIGSDWWQLVLEDGLKFTGTIAWASYHLRSALHALRAARPRAPATATMRGGRA